MKMVSKLFYYSLLIIALKTHVNMTFDSLFNVTVTLEMLEVMTPKIKGFLLMFALKA